MRRLLCCLLVLPAMMLGRPAEAQAQDAAASEESSLLDGLRWRSIGPANMGGRITDLAVFEGDPCTWWASTASGGLLKTTNNGITFEHQFDDQATVSVGAVEVSRTDANLLWVGTGEANPRNSVSWGNGVYKSADGGATWTHMGLDETFQVGGIQIHPDDHNVVYVGALGRLWGPNEQRGLFKTTDGGETWDKVLYINDETGVIDVKMSPDDPDTLLVATYERQRDGFDTNDPAKKWGDGGGLHRTTDGGETWQKISDGIPSGKLGRIGLDFYQADGDVVYMVLESENIGKGPVNVPTMGVTGDSADVGARINEITEYGPADQAGLQAGDIVIRVDDKTVHDWEQLVARIREHKPEDAITVEVSREKESVVVEIILGVREEERERPFGASLGGQQENVQDQQGDTGYEYGGVYRSADAGVSWTRINSVNPRPMYYSEIRVDPTDEQYLYVLGTSLYRSSDGGKTFTGDGHRGSPSGLSGRARATHVDHHAMWIDSRDPRHMILGNDGGIYVTHDRMANWEHHNKMAIGQFYHITVDNKRDYSVYGGLQDNGSWGAPARSRRDSGPINEDWMSIGGGDGFICRVDEHNPDIIYFESQNGGTARRDLSNGGFGSIRPTSQRGGAAGGRGGGGGQGQGRPRYRFNWRTPYILSNFNSKIYYNAGNHVFRSLDQGNGLKMISPEITRTERGSATALAESHFDSDVLYVGSDDGALWVTRNGGHEWENIYAPYEAPEPTEEDAEAEAEPAAPPTPLPAATPAPPAAPAAERPQREAGQRGQRNRANFDSLIADNDANNDGKLSREELPERMRRMFDRIDADGDGFISKEEIAAMQERRRGRGGPPPAGPVYYISTLDDPLSGHWEAETIGRDGGKFTMTLHLEGDALKGSVDSRPFKGDSTSGSFNADTRKLVLKFNTPQGELVFKAEVGENRMEGVLEAGQGMFTMRFVAERDGTVSADTAAILEVVTDDTAADPETVAVDAEAEADASEDIVSGDWEGSVTGPQIEAGEGQFTMTLKMKKDRTITGSFVAEVGDGDITEGKFNPEGNKITLGADMGGMFIDFTATIEGGRMKGQLSAAEGAMIMPFEATMTARAEPGAADDEEAAEPQGLPFGDLVPGPRWVSEIITSRHESGRVYVTLDGHRSNDDAPYVLVSEDEGKSWQSLAGSLPANVGSTRCIAEDLENENILYLGCEFGAWVSLDRGGTWQSLNTNLPTVAVHAIAQHKTAGEIVAGTHGRSAWVLDVTPIRQMTDEVRSASAHLFQPRTAHHWQSEPRRGGRLQRFVGQNPPDGASIYYLLGQDTEGATIEVRDATGAVVRTLEADTSAGLHRATWDLRGAPPQQEGQQQRRFRRRGRPVEPGRYEVTLTVGEDTYSHVVRVEGDPENPAYEPWTFSEDELLLMDEQFDWGQWEDKH